SRRSPGPGRHRRAAAAPPAGRRRWRARRARRGRPRAAEGACARSRQATVPCPPMAPTPAFPGGAVPAPPAVDLRSDTVTRPTPERRRAMAEAEVGDDGFGDDPTVARLEARFAELTGKEAAVFTPSGTMANQIALRALATPGSLVVVGRRQHVVTHEAGAAG